MYEYNAVVTNVVDADTIEVSIDLGLKVWLTGERLRLYGIDAYETRLGRGTTPKMKKLGLEGKEWVGETLWGIHGKITIETHRDKKGKYGRYLATVWYKIPGQKKVNLNKELVRLGYAVEKTY